MIPSLREICDSFSFASFVTQILFHLELHAFCAVAHPDTIALDRNALHNRTPNCHRVHLQPKNPIKFVEGIPFALLLDPRRFCTSEKAEKNVENKF